ncbi:NAD-dependent epimerase/dehydratase family protein [Gloeocapsa sp. PCC 73106]|uniref:NAD-dependent epimerase/dehydratase family protein n=1 Tax=Gloeocapsa sp. PCC 73106 TaxID=102232 RepID=UPI0002ACA6EF|nr:NAD-dependent epimerase/dehydratase family protein [Gloeocapsa sp. PCC 73106]ELR98323.1 nucleoside-diphosphate-sugar epimerase [Gloeocapsa sp. PCC 73106]
MDNENSESLITNDLEYITNNLPEEFQALANKKILITGGAGFLGYYLVNSILYWNKLHHNQIKITVYDNFIRGIPQWIVDLKEENKLEIVKHDITQPLPENIDDLQYIIHGASIASPTYYRLYPIETMDANVNGLRFLLEYCKRQKEKNQPVEGFLFYSTSEIYGDPQSENIPTPETYRGNVSCTGPRACYDESKRYGETLCVNFAKEYDLPIKITRPFNNYGPGLRIDDRRVIPDFSRDILADRDIVMFSDGSPTRTFCYVADAIIGYYKVLIKGRPGEAYNIGVEKPEISMRDLAEKLVDIAKITLGYQGKIVNVASPEKDYLVDNPNRRCPMITKAKQELGYEPKIDLNEGLKRTLIWYRDNRQLEATR